MNWSETNMCYCRGDEPMSPLWVSFIVVGDLHRYGVLQWEEESVLFSSARFVFGGWRKEGNKVTKVHTFKWNRLQIGLPHPILWSNKLADQVSQSSLGWYIFLLGWRVHPTHFVIPICQKRCNICFQKWQSIILLMSVVYEEISELGLVCFGKQN